MKHPFPSNILPYFTLITGVAGFRLCARLFSDMDEQQLLPTGHPAGTVLFILTAVVLGVLFLATRKISALPVSQKRLRSFRIFAAFCYVLGGLALIATAFADFSSGTVKLASLAILASAAGGLVMTVMAVFTLLGKSIPYGLPAVLTVVLMLDTVAQCQVWGTVPQIEAYFFPLLASVFLILTAYQKTAQTAGKGKPALLAFFSQSAVFFCFVSLCSHQWPLYLGMLFWASAQLYSCIYTLKEV